MMASDTLRCLKNLNKAAKRFSRHDNGKLRLHGKEYIETVAAAHYRGIVSHEFLQDVKSIVHTATGMPEWACDSFAEPFVGGLDCCEEGDEE